MSGQNLTNMTRTRTPARAWIAATVFLAEFMAILNGAASLISLKSIQRGLGFSDADLSWVINSYLLVFGGLRILGGRLADVFGRKHTFLAGSVLFAQSSALVGIAPTASMLVIARGVQGLSAAFMIPAALSILLSLYPATDERRRILATWSAVSATGSTAGLALGGLIVDTTSWRHVFVVNVPVALAVSAVALLGIRDSRPSHRDRFDIYGSVYVTSGVILLVYAVLVGNQSGWNRPASLLPAALAALAFLMFVRVERRHPAPAVRPDLLRVPTLAVANLAMFLSAGASMTAIYITTLHLQVSLGMSVLMTGVAYLPGSLTVLASTATVRALTPMSGLRAVLVSAVVMIAAGSLLLLSATDGGRYLQNIAPSVVLISFGSGCATVSLNMLATATLTEENAGVGTGLITTAQQVGGGFWLAMPASLTSLHRTAKATPSGTTFSRFGLPRRCPCWQARRFSLSANGISATAGSKNSETGTAGKQNEGSDRFARDPRRCPAVRRGG